MRRNLFFFEATLFDAVPGGARGARAPFEVRVAGASCRSARGPARTWTAIRRSGPRRSRGRSRCTAGPRSGCCARASTGSRSRSPTRAAATPVSPALEASLERDAAELPSARVLRRANREFEPLRTKLGFITHRLENMLDPLAREPGYADPQELRDDLWLVLESVGSGHVADGAIRRLLWQIDVFGFHVASLDVRQSASVVQEAVGGAAAGLRRRRTRRRASRCSRRRSPSGRRGLPPRRTARPASCCACSTRSCWRARRTAGAPCR